jgi:hypothetical protein
VALSFAVCPVVQQNHRAVNASGALTVDRTCPRH